MISHIRRLLDTDFARTKIYETVPHFIKRMKAVERFIKRMKAVERFMNSSKFKAKPNGRGLEGLARELLGRARELVKRGGQRLDK